VSVADTEHNMATPKPGPSEGLFTAGFVSHESYFSSTSSPN